jgi:hypothetical protein
MLSSLSSFFLKPLDKIVLRMYNNFSALPGWIANLGLPVHELKTSQTPLNLFQNNTLEL